MTGSNSKTTLLAHPLFRVGAFTLGYLAIATAFALSTGNTEFLFYCAVMVILIAATAAVHRSLSLTPGLLWTLSIWGALHMAGGLITIPDHWPADGEIRVLYSWWIIPKAAAAGTSGGWLKYDQVIHTYGFGIATWLCWQVLRGTLRESGSRPATGRKLYATPGLMFLVAAAGMGLGALNEVIEFIATRLTVTNVGGYVNTGWDLVYNTLGATVAALVLYRRERRGAPGDE